jgi:hypothetical protein
MDVSEGASNTSATGCGWTITVETLLTPAALAAIRTVPGERPVTSPVPEMLARAGFSLDQNKGVP